MHFQLITKQNTGPLSCVQLIKSADFYKVIALGLTWVRVESGSGTILVHEEEA